MAGRHVPAEPRAMVVTDQVEPVLPEGVRHGQDVRGHRGVGVMFGLRRPRAGTVAPEIGRHGRVAVGRQVLEERQPHVGRFGEPVQQDDERAPVSGAAHVVRVLAHVHPRLFNRHS